HRSRQPILFGHRHRQRAAIKLSALWCELSLLSRRAPTVETKSPGHLRGFFAICKREKSSPRAQLVALFAKALHNANIRFARFDQPVTTKFTAFGPLPFLSGSTSKLIRCPSFRPLSPACSTAVI